MHPDPDARKDWRQEEKGMTEDEMVGWHHWLNGHKFGWTPGVGDGQGGLSRCNSWGLKESDTMERLIWSDAPNIGAPQYIRQTLTDIKGETDSNTIIVGNFNTPLTLMDRSLKQKILNDALVYMDLIDIFRTFRPNAEEYTFFWSGHGIFSRIDHILGHKSNLSKFKKIEIISSIFSKHNALSCCCCC